MLIDQKFALEDRQRIEAWGKWLVQRLWENPKCPVPKARKQELTDALQKIEVLHRDDATCPPGFGGDGKVWLNDAAGESYGVKEAVFVHEAIHAIGGTELDGEAVELHCMGAEATKPTRDDWPKFLSETRPWKGHRVGTFVIWDPRTGECWWNDGDTDHPRKGMKMVDVGVEPGATEDP